MSAPQAFLTETRERFLKAVIAELPAERIRELYLFAPIRQGGVESGVAVIAAALPEPPDSSVSASGDAPPIAEQLGSVDLAGDDAAPIAEPLESGDSPAGDAPPIAERLKGDDSPAVGAAPTLGSSEMPDAGGAPATGDEEILISDSAACENSPPPPERYTVYTARYRHTQKGPDRGKWESSVVAEADAPLLSIETVVRGVQRRSGDVDPPDHMSGDDVRSALRIVSPARDA